METKLPVISLRIIVVHPNGRVLLLKRAASGQNSSPAWCLPGGKMDYGETARTGAIRELGEETGINCREKDLKFLFYQDSPAGKSGDMHCVNLYFSCRPDHPFVVLNEESEAHAWIGPDDMEKYSIVFHNDIGLMCYWKNEVPTDFS